MIPLGREAGEQPACREDTMTHLRKALMCGASTAFILTAAPALAQGQAPVSTTSDATTVDEIIVTATRCESTLLETPVAVTAVDQNSLIRSGVADFTDIAKLVPNLGIGMSPNEGGVQISIRGVSSNNFTEIGDPAVAFHVDGI